MINTISLTANHNDFVGPIHPATITELRGLCPTTKVHGIGKVQWTMRHVFGTTRTIKKEANSVPDATVCLFSPQTYFREKQRGKLTLEHSSTTMQLHDGSTLQFPYNTNSNLPLMLPALPNHIGLTFDDACDLGDGHSMHNYMSVADESNQNLVGVQKQLLLLCVALGIRARKPTVDPDFVSLSKVHSQTLSFRNSPRQDIQLCALCHMYAWQADASHTRYQIWHSC